MLQSSSINVAAELPARTKRKTPQMLHSSADLARANARLSRRDVTLILQDTTICRAAQAKHSWEILSKLFFSSLPYLGSTMGVDEAMHIAPASAGHDMDKARVDSIAVAEVDSEAGDVEKPKYSQLSVWLMVLYSGLAIGSDG